MGQSISKVEERKKDNIITKYEQIQMNEQQLTTILKKTYDYHTIPAKPSVK